MEEKSTPVKNRSITERKLLAAVGTIIQRKGYANLGVNKIAREAGVDKVLIYRYFKTIDNLIATYLSEKDYWITLNKVNNSPVNNRRNKDTLIQYFGQVLDMQFEYFNSEDDSQRIMLWEVTEKTDLLNEIGKARERALESLLEIADPHFKDSTINFRAVLAIMVSGVYHSVLYAQKNEGSICGIDLHTEIGKGEFKKALKQITSLAFKGSRMV